MGSTNIPGKRGAKGGEVEVRGEKKEGALGVFYVFGTFCFFCIFHHHYLMQGFFLILFHFHYPRQCLNFKCKYEKEQRQVHERITLFIYHHFELK